MKVVTRFPPSPTGSFHIGSARTALFNHLFTAHHGGTMYLRFEDTDKARSKKEYEEDILAGLAWLNIPYTLPEVYRQSGRTEQYKAALQKLFDSGAAYISEEVRKDDPSTMVSLVRLKNPGKSVTFTDLIRGDVTFDTTELGDFVIARNVDDPLYHLTVVSDDEEMGVTHVIRGEDHISNTARQILILEALGYARPEYAHIPLIFAPDRSKLSKRHGAVSLSEYRKDGYLPEAMNNYLALLGWNPGGDREVYSIQELIGSFDLKDVQKGGAIFDIEKLRWFNKEYLNKMDDDGFAKYVQPALELLGESAKDNVGLHKLLRERIATTNDVRKLIDEGELDFLKSTKPFKGEWMKDPKTFERLQKMIELLSAVSEGDFMNAEAVKAAIWDYATEEGRKNVLQPMREILSGKKQSPDPFTIASVLGKKEAIERLRKAIEALKQ